MQVELLHFTPLQVCKTAIRTCWDSHAKSDSTDYCIGKNDLELIDRVGNKNKHKSVLEHIVYSFSIIGISRGCLQELARHRIASLSVKSTRYTLKELKEEESFLPYSNYNKLRALKYLVQSPDEEVFQLSVRALENVRILIQRGISNDITKHTLPESYKTSLVWTINARSLQNFLELRNTQQAHFEIRELAQAVLANLPQSHRFLFNIL